MRSPAVQVFLASITFLSGSKACPGRHQSILETTGCKSSEFQCKNENRNQILTINDFNKEKEKCIPGHFRCDGRHDCQDGSDEYDCDFSSVTVSREFHCFSSSGSGSDIDVTDCVKYESKINRDQDNMVTFSVSESLEWVCTKTIYSNGSVHKGCEKRFTGGETVSICYGNQNKASPLMCLCSRPLCNSSGCVTVTIIRHLQHPGPLSYFMCLLLFLNLYH